ncbi:hypothetical protein WDW89_16185 [Deltaproteobacteria bacterium TL4]
MHTIEQFDLSLLPDKAQEELYDFFLFLKQRYARDHHKSSESEETKVSVEDLFPRKLSNLKPLTRDEIYDR